MEEKQLYIVYSNDNKKTRLKRSKKYKRVWDAKSQKYVKVKKIKKRICMTNKELKEFFASPNSQAQTSTTPAVKSVKTKKQKRENKQTEEQVKAHVAPKNSIQETLGGRTLVWDSNTKRYVFYKEAA